MGHDSGIMAPKDISALIPTPRIGWQMDQAADPKVERSSRPRRACVTTGVLTGRQGVQLAVLALSRRKDECSSGMLAASRGRKSGGTPRGTGLPETLNCVPVRLWQSSGS